MMTSGIGKAAPRGAAAFTLIEIILVLALITIASGIAIANFTAFAGREDARSTEELLREAIREARFLAARERVITKLGFDEENGSLRITGGAGGTITYELGERFTRTGPAEIRFYAIPPGEGLDPRRLGGARPRGQPEMARVRFAPDRSSTPFAVAIDQGSGQPRRIRFDPFSSLPRAEP